MVSSNLTFTEGNSKRGIFFYRMIALVSVSFNVALIALFLFSLDGVSELWWDRILCLLFSLSVYIWGFKKNLDTKRYVLVLKILFYVQVTQMAIVAGKNDFSVFYFLTIFMVQQSFAYCLRTNREAYFFLSYCLLLNLYSIYFISNIPAADLSLFASVSVAITLLGLLTCVVKSRFLDDMKMNQGLLRMMLSKVDMAVFLTDDTGIIFDLNPRVKELFGYEREELIGRDFKLFRKYYLTEEEVLSAYEDFDKNKFWNTETILLTKTNEEIHAKVSVAPIINGNKRVLVYRIIDITSIKENENRLIEAKVKAEEAVQVKGQFLAMMSHEIRTPLNGVIATASILSKTEMDMEQSDYVDTIKKSGQSLLMLINDILDFSKMESGKMKLDLQPFSPDDIVFEVADLLRPYAEEKGVKLHVRTDLLQDRKLMLDSLRLKQVLLNLLGNALKFTEAGSVSITLERVNLSAGTETFRYSVSDTGIGIPEDKMHLLFQSFSQIDSSTSRKYGGTGLGLAISRQIVELMGGEIHVESKLNEGTTFRFELTHEVCGSCEKRVGNVVTHKARMADFSSLKVLVADDNEINRQVFHYMLGALQINADMAEDGYEVLEQCASQNYDIIFMDMQMPGMDGLEATCRIRNELLHQPVIVAVTANSYHEDKEKCRNAGMSEFLSKPFEHEQLLALMNRLVNDSRINIEPAA